MNGFLLYRHECEFLHCYPHNSPEHLKVIGLASGLGVLLGICFSLACCWIVRMWRRRRVGAYLLDEEEATPEVSRDNETPLVNLDQSNTPIVRSSTGISNANVTSSVFIQ